MLKKVFFFDIFIGITITPLIKLIFNDYAYLFLLGLTIASLGFIVSSVATKNYLSRITIKYGAIMHISNFVKVILICIIGVIIYNNNVNNVIFYIFGFTSHFLALILYGIVNLLGERK
jgi:ATP synthase protein I